eukprot:Gb_34232 [translate_table: standard]
MYWCSFIRSPRAARFLGRTSVDKLEHSLLKGFVGAGRIGGVAGRALGVSFGVVVERIHVLHGIRCRGIPSCFSTAFLNLVLRLCFRRRVLTFSEQISVQSSRKLWEIMKGFDTDDLLRLYQARNECQNYYDILKNLVIRALHCTSLNLILQACISL